MPSRSPNNSGALSYGSIRYAYFKTTSTTGLKNPPQWQNIYHQATCVIAAHSARDDSEGFLYTSRSSLIQAHPTQAYTKFHEQVNQSGLSQRGWVFQERILSKRIFHFTNHDLFLEDASGIGLVNEGGLVRLSGDSPDGNKLNVEDAFHNSAQWYRLVERYSHCELTCDIDRLPAIIGLAQIFKEMSGCGRFMFGLWHEPLHLGLLWIQTARNPVRLKDAYRSGCPCPTWSWAAWKGSLSFPSCLEALESCISPLQKQESPLHTTVLENLGPQVPTLAISGKLRTLSDVQVTFNGDMESKGRFAGGRCEFVSTKPRMYGFAFFDGLGAGDERRFERIWLLLVAEHCNKRPIIAEEDAGTVAYHFRFTYYFLVLEEAGGPGLYRRVGMGARSRPNVWGDADKTTVFIV